MRKKYVLNLILNFIIGYVLFNLVFVFTQRITVSLLGFSKGLIDIYLENFKLTIIIYLIIYNLFIVSDYIYKAKTKNALNKKLKILKERGDLNEK